jgi:putative membrane protein insertion efficiency factor
MMCSKPHVSEKESHACVGDAQGLTGATEITSDNAVEQNMASRLLSWSMVTAIRFYQRGISPLLGKNCRYQPTCSEYFILAVKKYGPLRGAWKGTWRIMRCHPFRPGGYDPP